MAANAVLMSNFRDRLTGVIGRKVTVGEAYGITDCDWVHTFFVSGPLDLLYCDSAGLVLLTVQSLPPFRLGPRVPGASIVWELVGGTLRKMPVVVGDVINYG